MKNRDIKKIKPYERFHSGGQSAGIIEATSLADLEGEQVFKVIKSFGNHKKGQIYYVSAVLFSTGYFRPLPPPPTHPLAEEVLLKILEKPEFVGQLAKAGAVQHKNGTYQTKQKIVRIFKEILPRELIEEIAECQACGVPH